MAYLALNLWSWGNGLIKRLGANPECRGRRLAAPFGVGPGVGARAGSYRCSILGSAHWDTSDID